ncbi:hypothetical protein KOR34_07650 [Posidoniimonas corsicana]|uniref:Helix-turn-helix domain-containing protein n=1 Tax=Posidoniimonas corsicana TaxID=1938618 RepID=A0A5C5VD90_9BACT|nr:helix-turn-helix domain-containing protein [Posidoniimonas corsicana]TWT35869.1 hypothetical protein KOR34_07650 [Posidoniimonas corsicana]
MTINLDPADLRPIVEAVVSQAIQDLAAVGGDSRLAYPEAEAASLLGIRAHQLRDARLRGEITATKLGGRLGYERSELLAYLARQRQQ